MANKEHAVAVYQPSNFQPAPSTGLALTEAKQLGTILAESGYFGDRVSAAQAVVKIIKGQSLGIDPVSAMQGMDFVQGKLTMGAGLIASLIQRSGRFAYRVVDHTDERCEIEFADLAYTPERVLGVSVYTTDDAKKAELLGKPMWTKYRRNMLFARALSNGARWHCPAVFNGPVYTPEEMRDNPDGDAPQPQRRPEPTPIRPADGREQAKRAAGVAAMATAADAPIVWRIDPDRQGCQAVHPEKGGCPAKHLDADLEGALPAGVKLCAKHYRAYRAVGGVDILPTVDELVPDAPPAPADNLDALHAEGQTAAEGLFEEVDDDPFERPD